MSFSHRRAVQAATCAPRGNCDVASTGQSLLPSSPEIALSQPVAAFLLDFADEGDQQWVIGVIGVRMCSLVEIKNHDEIYIHYLSGERGNVQKITIVGDALKNVKEDDNNNVEKEVLITHKNKDAKGEKLSSVDLGVKEGEDSEQTSDRASSMGSSVTGADNAKDLKDFKSEDTKDLNSENLTDLKDLKGLVEDVKATTETTGGGVVEEARNCSPVVEVAKKVKAKVKCREMATQVEPMRGKGRTKNKTGR